MTRRELKQLIKETIAESNMGAQISPQVKQKMIARLQNAIQHVQKINTMEELASLDSSEYDEQKGTFAVQIYSNRIDR